MPLPVIMGAFSNTIRPMNTYCDALAPRYIESLPRDVIGGQPLKYRRTSNGQFALYSVGWNGTDDGGAVVLKEYSNTSIDLNQGDWVWTGQVMSGQ